MDKDQSLNLCPQCKAVLKPGQEICKVCASKDIPQKSRKLLRWILSFLGVFLVLIGLQCWWVKDGPPPKDDDLQIAITQTDPGKNGYTYLEEAGQKISFPEKKDGEIAAMAKGEKWDAPRVAELLVKNQEALKLFGQALKCSQCIVPVKRYTVDMKLPSLLAWRRLAQIGSLRGWQLQKAGKEKEAAEAFLEVVRFGSMAENCRGPLISYMIGAAIKDIGLESLRNFVKITILKSGDLLPLVQQLSHYEASSEEGMVYGWKAEYLWGSHVIDDTMAGKIKGGTGGDQRLSEAMRRIPYFFQPNNTKRVSARLFREYIKTTRCKDYQKVKEQMERTQEWLKKEVFVKNEPSLQEIREMLKPNGIGRTLLSISIPNFSIAIKIKFENQATLRLIQIFIAMKAYKADHGKLPASLGDLLPKYLKSIPPDPFADGKSLQYDEKTKELHSAGRDEKDVNQKQVVLKVDF